MQAKVFLPIRFAKPVGKPLLREFWKAKLNPCWDYSHCSVVVIRQKRMLNEGNLIGMQCKPSICRVNVIRGETSSVFCQNACRQSNVYISTHSSSSLTGAPRCKPSNSFDLGTGLNSVCLLRKHQEMFAETGEQINAVQVHCFFSSSMNYLKHSQLPNPQPFIERMQPFSLHWGLKRGCSLDHKKKQAQQET